jgi:probable phosphoglycerate mutase
VKRLILVRHGNTFEEGMTPIQVGCRTDLPLTSYGQAQAKALLFHADSVYSGPLKRHKETALVFGKNVIIEPALNEIDYGPWEGLTADEIKAKWPQEYEAWNAQGKWPHGIFVGTPEKHLEMLKNWVKTLSGTVVGVTSGGILRLLGPNQPKVNTGHYCEFDLNLNVLRWNVKP